MFRKRFREESGWRLRKEYQTQTNLHHMRSPSMNGDIAWFTRKAWNLMRERVTVAPSTTHGFGVFSTRPFKYGAVVGYYQGPPWSGKGRDTFVHYWRAFKSDETAIVVKGPLKYMNHAKEPNCDIRDETRDELGRPRTTIIAVRAIEEGEELTRFYSDYFQQFLERTGRA
jgi:SET domain-containing protein